MRATLIVAVAIAVVWWAPWDSSPSAIAGARAAFGSGPIVHVIALAGVAATAGATRPVVNEKQWEIWSDPSRRLFHLVERQGGKTVADTLGRTPGPIDPALDVFVSRYGAELARRRLRPAGSGKIQDRRVLWLQSARLLVAIDPVSYQALWVRLVTAGAPSGPLVQIVRAETVPAGSGDLQTQKTKRPRHL